MGQTAIEGGGGGRSGFTSADDANLRDNLHIVIYIFLSIAFLNVFELIIHIVSTFKHLRGLYCWSCIGATFGVAVNGLGFLMEVVSGLCNISPWLYCTFILVGWAFMVTGQSLVLYSRLHIVLHSHWILRAVLCMIITHAISLGVPLFTLLYLENSANPEPYFGPYANFEKVQLSLIFCQEVTISTLYIVETFRILRSQRGLATGGSKRIMTHLILVNLLAIFVDASILVFEFGHHYNIQMAWKPLAYSIKLKMEFGVLNRLVELSQRVRMRGGLALIDDTPPADVAGLPLQCIEESSRSGNRSLNNNGSDCHMRSHPSTGDQENKRTLNRDFRADSL